MTFARRLRRRVRILSLLPAAWWMWSHRELIGGMAGFARTVPDRLRLGRGSEVALAAKVNLALLRDPRLAGADLRLGAVQGGDVCIEVERGSEAAGEIARTVVERVPGVASVRIEDASAVATPSGAPSTVAGGGVVEDLAGGAVGSPAGEGDMPVRI